MGFSAGQIRPQPNTNQQLQNLNERDTGSNMPGNLNLMMNSGNNNNTNQMMPGIGMDIHFPPSMGMSPGNPGMGGGF